MRNQLLDFIQENYCEILSDLRYPASVNPSTINQIISIESPRFDIDDWEALLQYVSTRPVHVSSVEEAKSLLVDIYHL